MLKLMMAFSELIELTLRLKHRAPKPIIKMPLAIIISNNVNPFFVRLIFMKGFLIYLFKISISS